MSDLTIKWVECIDNKNFRSNDSLHRLTLGKIYKVLNHYQSINLTSKFIKIEEDGGEIINFSEFHFKDITKQIERDLKLNKILS